MKSTPYRETIKRVIDRERSSMSPGQYNMLLDRMYLLLNKCEPSVRRIARVNRKDVEQAGVSVVGDLFAWGTAYVLQLIQAEGGLSPDLSFHPRPKKHNLIEKYGTIQVAGEILKPDIDLLIYSNQPDTPLVFVNMKTSLRERAGQTHRWKIVLDIALHCKQLKEKYELKYQEERPIKFAFATTNFYDELSKPQQRANIRFFDFVYLARDDRQIPASVSRFSQLPADLRSLFPL